MSEIPLLWTWTVVWKGMDGGRTAWKECLGEAFGRRRLWMSGKRTFRVMNNNDENPKDLLQR